MKNVYPNGYCVYEVKQSEISITRHYSALSLRQKTHTRWNAADQIRTWWGHFAITRPLGTRASCNCLIWLILIWLIQINRQLFNDNIKKRQQKGQIWLIQTWLENFSSASVQHPLHYIKQYRVHTAQAIRAGAHTSKEVYLSSQIMQLHDFFHNAISHPFGSIFTCQQYKSNLRTMI